LKPLGTRFSNEKTDPLKKGRIPGLDLNSNFGRPSKNGFRESNAFAGLIDALGFVVGPRAIEKDLGIFFSFRSEEFEEGDRFGPLRFVDERDEAIDESRIDATVRCA
jgi:hypothetical protein